MAKLFTERDLQAALAAYMRTATKLADSDDVAPDRKDHVRAMGGAIVEQGFTFLSFVDRCVVSEQDRANLYSLVFDMLQASFELGGASIVTKDQEAWRQRRQAALARASKTPSADEIAMRRIMTEIVARYPAADFEKRGFAGRVLKHVNIALIAEGRPPVLIGAVRRRLPKVRD